MRVEKEKKKVMFQENTTLVSEINSLHNQEEQAKKKHAEHKKDFEILERSDALVNNEKKNKVAERIKFEKKIKELEEEKVQVAKRNEDIVAEMPEIE